MATNLMIHANSLLAADGADPPLQFHVDTMIFSLIIFALLMLVLWRYGWKPIMEGLDKREKSISDDINSAKQANEKAQNMLAQYEEKLASAGEEANRIIAEAKDEANRAKERILNDAKAETERLREQSLAEIKAAKDQAVRDLAEKSVDSAVTLAKNMVGKELDRSAHTKLIEESLKRFSQDNQFSNN